MQHKRIMDKDLLVYSQKVDLQGHYVQNIKQELVFYIKYKMLLNLQKWLYSKLLFSWLKDVEFFNLVL